MEVFRKYLWYVLRERKFDQGAVEDLVALKVRVGQGRAGQGRAGLGWAGASGPGCSGAAQGR